MQAIISASTDQGTQQTLLRNSSKRGCDLSKLEEGCSNIHIKCLARHSIQMSVNLSRRHNLADQSSTRLIQTIYDRYVIQPK
jgi:hypothetical protein